MCPYLFSYRFRWVFCQLEVLRDCFPASIRQTLDQLPESLDDTYLRVLSQIPQANQAHAHRMLQCLVVAVRPLRVEELAELLAFEFDAAPGGIPKYRAAWRLDNQTQAVLSTCSSLVTIIPWNGRQVVQFSHFSVKEFLMTDRLTSPLGDFSRYRIRPEPAHTILTQACLGFLLHLDDRIEKTSVKGFPLAEYAARHWVEHAQFAGVASHVKGGMETLFDPDKPHFAAWIGIYDIDILQYDWRNFWGPKISPNPNPNPLYYSVLCGLYDLSKHLANKHPQHINAICGQYRFPLVAALNNDHVDVAELLLRHGANIDGRGATGETVLLMMLSRPQRNLINKVKLLLQHGADVNAQDYTLKSPLHLAELRGEFEVARMLIMHKADVNSEDKIGKTPLHMLLEGQMYSEVHVLDHVRLLLDHGAEANRRDKNNQTPLLLSMWRSWFKLAQILLEHGADPNVENNNGKTPLHLLSESRTLDEGDALDLIWHLLERGAAVNRKDKNNQTPLILALRRNWIKLVRILLEHGADPNAENNNCMTPLHILSARRIYNKSDACDVLKHRRLRLEHGAELNRRYKDNETPLLLEIGTGTYKFAWKLLSLTQTLPWRTKSQRTRYHEAYIGLGNLNMMSGCSVLHSYYPSAA